MLSTDELNQIKDRAATQDVNILLAEVARLRAALQDYAAVVTKKIDEIEVDMGKLEAENRRLLASKEGVYVERDACIALLARLAVANGFRAGRAPQNNVVVDLPNGQVSWDYNESEAHLFEALPDYPAAVEELSVQEKYHRVMNCAILGSPSAE